MSYIQSSVRGQWKQVASRSSSNLTCHCSNRVTAETLLSRCFSTTIPARDDTDNSNTSRTRVRARKAPTSHRRKMYAWLCGPGKNFLHASPGATNYLGMYRFMGGGGGLVNRRLEQRNRRAQQRGDGDTDAAVQQNDQDEPQSWLSPFPLNKAFFSQPVLSDALKEEIYTRAVEDEEPLSSISVALDVDVRRVAAVIRMKMIEIKWQSEGKQFATEYASAVMDMLPQTRYDEDTQTYHESTTDLPVHPDTQQQIFYPISESRQFTRTDAAKVFSPTLLPADKRIQHASLLKDESLWTDAEDDPQDEDEDAFLNSISDIEEEAEQASKKFRDMIIKNNVDQDVERSREEIDPQVIEEMVNSIELSEEDLDQIEAGEEHVVENKSAVDTVKARRWDFKFEHIEADNVGRNPRDSRGVGWRYGMPHEDRKRGQNKRVPLSVCA